MKPVVLSLLLALTAAPATAQSFLPGGDRTMPAFVSDSAFRTFLRGIIAERARRERGMARSMNQAASPMAGADGSADAITNNQHAGVDEGGIVKLSGNHLVILRRGRLFTVAVGGGDLRPASTSDAFGPGIEPSGTWYDEMLISGDRVVVIGYSYARGGTEVGIFRLGTDGTLRYQSTFQLRSNDYYSSRNYSARLIGSRLVFYAPLYLPWSAARVDDLLPAVRQWRGQASENFVPIVRGERVYRPAGWQAGDNIALHTVTSCDLAAADIDCEATVVVGPAGRVFYVSQAAVYVWMSDYHRRGAPSATGSLLTRIPLDGTARRPCGSREARWISSRSSRARMVSSTCSHGPTVRAMPCGRPSA